MALLASDLWLWLWVPPWPWAVRKWMGRASAEPPVPHPKFQVARFVTVSVSRGCLLGMELGLTWPGSRRFRLSQRPRLSPGTRCLLRCGCRARAQRPLPRRVPEAFTSSSAGIWRRTMWSVKESNVRPGPFRRLAASASNSNGDRNWRRARHRVACNGTPCASLAGEQPRTACRARPAVPTATPTPRRPASASRQKTQAAGKYPPRNRIEIPWPHETRTAARAGRRRLGSLVPPATRGGRDG